jgi:Flp pilus assembly protein TadD
MASRAIRGDPRPQYLASLGLTLRQAGRLEDALGVFDKAIQLKPDDAELWRHWTQGQMSSTSRRS